MESKKAIYVNARHELVIVSSLIGLLIISIIAPWIIPRVVLGIPFVMFFPGYSLLSALFPKKGQLDLLERLIISFGFSLIIVVLIAFIINYTPWGLRLIPLFASYSLFIWGMSLTSYYERKRLPEEERFEIVIPLSVPLWNNASQWSKGFSLLLIASIVIAIGSIGFALIKPKQEEKFTELYVLGKEGKAANYPQAINLGEEAIVKVGIVNHEQRTIPYLLEIRIGGAPAFTKNNILLKNKEGWEDVIPLSPTKIGNQQKVEIDIYRPGDTNPYQYLILWIDVIEKSP